MSRTIPPCGLLRAVPRISALSIALALGAAACSTNQSAAATPDLQNRWAEVANNVVSVKEQQTFEAERGRITETAIQSCMRFAGFDYKPFYGNYLLDDVGLELMVDFSDRDYARRHGFGLVDSTRSVGNGPVDPNDIRALGLGDNQQAAYYNALDGPFDAANLKADSESCRDFGEKAFLGAIGGNIEGNWLQEVDLATLAAPEVQAAATEWQQCAASQGFDFASRRHLIAAIDNHIANSTGEGGRDLSEPFDPDTANTLQQIRAYEVNAALATFECSQSYDQIFLETFRTNMANE